MQTIRKIAVTVIGFVVGVGGGGTGAAATPPVRTGTGYCGVMQQFIAGTRLPAATRQYEAGDYDGGFKKSKPTAKPQVTHQYVGYLLAQGETTQYPVSVSCKLKTAERIRAAHADGDNGAMDLPVAAERDRTCQQWTAALLDAIYRSLAAPGGTAVTQVRGGKPPRILPRESIQLDEEDNVYIGPLWVRPFPFQPAYSRDGVLHLRSKALHAEYSRWLPLPDSFMGTHYCHTIAPEYLRALVLGEIAAPPLP